MKRKTTRQAITPIISLFTGGIDFSSLGYRLSDGEDGAIFAYGNFIMALINFLIIAFVVFLLVKAVNRAKEASATPEEEAPAEDPGPSEKDILVEIRDALRKA